MKRYFRICALDFLFLVTIFIVSFIYGITFSDDSIGGSLDISIREFLFALYAMILYPLILAYFWGFNIVFFIPKIKNYVTLLVILQGVLPYIVLIIMGYETFGTIFKRMEEVVSGNSRPDSTLPFFIYIFYKLFVLRLWDKPERNTIKAKIKRYLDICALDILFYVVVFGSFILFLTLFKSHSQDDLFDQLIVWFAIFHLWVLNISFFIPKIKDNFKVLMFLQIIVAVVAYYSFQTNEFIYTLGNGLEMYKLGNSSFFEILKYYISSNINYFIEDIKNIESSYKFLLFLFFLLPFMFYKFYVIRKWNKSDEGVLL